MSLFTQSPQTYVALPTGAVFGAMLIKSQMYKSEQIRAQMRMKAPNRMLKTFLSAAGASALILSLIDYFNGPIETKIVGYNWRRQLLGGALMGIGMNLGGACPGTVLAQLGAALGEKSWSNIKRALVTLLGSVSGAALYASQHENVNKLLGDFGRTWTLSDITGIKYWKLGLPFAALMYATVGLVVVAEKAIIDNDLANDRINDFEAETLAEERIMANGESMCYGSVIGLLQAPFYALGHVHLGTSTSYVTLVEPFIRNKYTQSASFAKNAFQVLSNTGIVLGSWFTNAKSRSLIDVSSESQQDNLDKRDVITKYWRPFVSGVLLVGGARMAGGCTSGHGLSGMALLSVSSFIAVASMFGAGMVTAAVEDVLTAKKE